MATVYRCPYFHVGGYSPTADVYIPFGMGRLDTNGTTANRTRVKMYRTGYVQNAQIYVRVNSLSGDSSLTLYKNDVATAMTVPIPAGLTGLFTFDTDTIGYVSGDELYWFLDRGTGTTITIEYAGADNLCTTAHGKHVNTNGSLTSMATNRYNPIGGLISSSLSTVTYTSRNYVPMDGVASNAYLHVPTNTRNGDSTWTFQVNGADSSLVVTVPAGLTGYFEDATNTAAYNAGDYIGWKWVLGGSSGAAAPVLSAVETVADTAGSMLMALSSIAGSASANQYYCPSGGLFSGGNSTYVHRRMRHFGSGTITKARMEVGVNTRNVDTNFTFYRNVSATTTAIDLTIPATTTGLFTDDDSVSYTGVADDVFAMRYTTPAGTGGVNMPSLSFEYQIDSETYDPPAPPSGSANFIVWWQ